MPYAASSLYWYVRSIILSGLKSLFKQRYLPFTIVLFALSIISTIMPHLSGVEGALGLAMFFGQLWLVIPLFLLFFVSYSSWSFILPFFFYLWFGFLALVVLLICRDFVDSWAGHIYFLGVSNRVPLTHIFNAVFGIGIGISLVFVDIFSVAFILISMFMIYVVNVFARIEKNNIFATIISFFYVFVLYNFFMMKNVARQFSSFFLIIDVFIALLAMFFVAAKFIKPFQSRVPFINNKTIVYSTLGLLALFHVYTLNTAFFQSMHTALFILSVSIISAALPLFYLSPSFHDYFSRKPSVKEAVKQAATTVASEFFGKIIMKVEKP